MSPSRQLSPTACQPGSDTVLIQASRVMSAGEQIVSDGPVSAQSATQRKTSNLSLSSKPAPNRAFLPAWGMQKTQQETPGLSLSSKNTPSFDQNPTQITISYTYDSLYRLTDAVYSNGFEFHYTYDPVGNRLTQTTCAPGVPCSTTTYGYDATNRLTSVNGVTYKWDDNGNLLDDGTSTYAYDSQNRLTTLTQAGHTYGFSYSGNGDRLTQTVDGVVTRYTLDVEAGLTQVLSDGSDTYLYGNERIAQLNSGETDYFLGDALGSVRQLVDANAVVKLAQSYEPFGTVMGSAGSETSAYGFDGESQTGGLVHLRARSYSSLEGRFLSADPSLGDPQQPMSFDAWMFTYGDPVNLVDRNGDKPCSDLLQLAASGGMSYAGAPELRAQYATCVATMPGLTNNDVTVDPWNISWYPSVTLSLDPGIPINTPGAQYLVYPEHRDWTELCGDVALGAILRLTEGNISARDVADAFTAAVKAGTIISRSKDKWNPNSLGPDDVINLVNHVYNRNWSAPLQEYRTDYISASSSNWTNRDASLEVGAQLHDMLEAGTYPLITVGIEIAEGRLIRDPVLDTRWKNINDWTEAHKNDKPKPAPVPDSSDYSLCANPVVCHWVVITGISNEWAHSWGSNTTPSLWQWVRVYNPFANETEYYLWGDLYESWSGVGGIMIPMERQPKAAANFPQVQCP